MYATDMGVLQVRTAMLLGYYDRLHSTGTKTSDSSKSAVKEKSQAQNRKRDTDIGPRKHSSNQT